MIGQAGLFMRVPSKECSLEENGKTSRKRRVLKNYAVSEGIETLAISEIIGTLVLVGVVVVGIALVGIFLLSNPTPSKVPAFDAIISNQSRAIYIYHQGGDSLWAGQYRILVDGGDQTGNFTIMSPENEPWSVGETLRGVAPAMPRRVVIVFIQSGGGEIVLRASDLQPSLTVPTLTTPPTTIPTPSPSPPTMAWSSSPVFGNATTTFTFTDSSTGGNISSYFWNFNDGNTSTLKSPAHVFPNTTAEYYQYSINHSATDSGGTGWEATSWLNRSAWVTIYKNSTPTVTFTNSTWGGTVPVTVTFNATQVGAIKVDTWNWTFGDGGTSTSQNQSYTYTAAGTYTVTLTATNFTLGVTTVTKANLITALPGAGTCTLAVNATSSGTAAVGATTLTISHTTSGSDRLMLVGVSIDPEGDYANLYVSSRTYNSVAMTKIGSVRNDDDATTEIWRLIAPDTGTHNVVITSAKVLVQPAAAGVMTFTGVNQTAPNGTFASQIGNDDYQINVTVPSATGELVFGVITDEYNSVITDSGQTERWNRHIADGSGDVNGAGSTKAGASSVLLKWTFSGTYNHWATAGVSIKACSSPTPPSGGPWYDSSWLYRKNITIDKSKVTGTLTNFPVLINLSSDSNLRDSAQPDGDDILFTKSDLTTKIPHEIENYTSGTGALIAWVNVSSLSSTANTSIFMYYGNSGASNQQNPTAVWDSNYSAVYHLNQNPSGTVVDSTGHANLGSEGTMGAANLVNAKIGKGIYLTDYSSNRDHLVSTNTVTVRNFTLEAWANFVTRYNWSAFVEVNTHAGTWRDFTADSSAYAIIDLATSGTSDITQLTGVLSTGQHHVVARYNRSTQVVDGFLDGSPAAYSESGVSKSSVTGLVTVGAWFDYTDSLYYDVFRGSLDEVRISNIARSNSWIQTGYANQNSPSTFYSVGSQEAYA